MPDDRYVGWDFNAQPVPTAAPVENQDATPSGAPPLPPLINNLLKTNLVGFGKTVEYLTEMGLRSSPLAAGFGAKPVKFWRSGTGRGWKVISTVSIAYVGQGDPNPVLPDPDTGSANDVLKWWRAVLFTPPNGLEGSQVRGVLLVLFYALQKAPVLGVDVLDFGASPSDSTPPAQNVLNPVDFYKYLSAASAVSGEPGTPINF